MLEAFYFLSLALIFFLASISTAGEPISGFTLLIGVILLVFAAYRFIKEIDTSEDEDG